MADQSGNRDPYCQPNGCLRNLLGLTDPTELASVEARVASTRDVEIATTTIPGEYDLEHYQRFHRALFRDVYDWAGQLRTVNITKAGNTFCLAEFVADQMSAVLTELARDRWLIGRPRSYFADHLAHYYGELNACHPFREGNGRALRAFLRQLAAAAGWRLDWSALNREDNAAASAHNFATARHEQLAAVLEPVIHRI